MPAVDAWRSKHTAGNTTRIDHVDLPTTESLLWLPDIVAGAVLGALAREPLSRREIEAATGLSLHHVRTALPIWSTRAW